MPSSTNGQHDVTALMQAAADGDTSAGDRLLPLVYDQLRRAAQQRLAGERPDHTLSATALVHEAYLKLAGPREVPWAGRRHFYVAAAEAMRQILLDHAKARGRLKRGGGVGGRRVPLSVADVADSWNLYVAAAEAMRRTSITRAREPLGAAVVFGWRTSAMSAPSPRQILTKSWQSMRPSPAWRLTTPRRPPSCGCGSSRA